MILWTLISDKGREALRGNWPEERVRISHVSKMIAELVNKPSYKHRIQRSLPEEDDEEDSNTQYRKGMSCVSYRTKDPLAEAASPLCPDFTPGSQVNHEVRHIGEYGKGRHLMRPALFSEDDVSPKIMRVSLHP